MVPLYLDCGCAILTDGSRAPGCPTCSASTSWILALTPEQDGPRCRQCGCVDEDCSSCIERTGEPCFWFEPDLCSGCAFEHLSQELPAPPCSLCGQDDKMKQLPSPSPTSEGCGPGLGMPAVRHRGNALPGRAG